MEPKDWINTGLEDDTGGVEMGRQGGEQTRPLRGFEVELRRKPGEGFGFVIASQDLENGKGKTFDLSPCTLESLDRKVVFFLFFFRCSRTVSNSRSAKSVCVFNYLQSLLLNFLTC